MVSSDERARLLLRTGIAGAPVRTSAALLFEERAVRDVALRPRVDLERLWDACPLGLYVARLARNAELDLTRPWPDLAGQVVGSIGSQRRMPALVWALTAVQIHVSGRLPFAATYLGFVVLTADLAGLDADGPMLTSPGAWADGVTGRRLPTPSGGRPGYMLMPPRGPRPAG